MSFLSEQLLARAVSVTPAGTHHSGLVTTVSTTVPGGGFLSPPPISAKNLAPTRFFTTITVSLGLKERKREKNNTLLENCTKTISGADLLEFKGINFTCLYWFKLNNYLFNIIFHQSNFPLTSLRSRKWTKKGSSKERLDFYSLPHCFLYCVLTVFLVKPPTKAKEKNWVLQLLCLPAV